MARALLLCVAATVAATGLHGRDVPGSADEFSSVEEYIAFLKDVVDCDTIGDAEKIRPRWLLEIALKNRPGSPAADFAFKGRDGAPSTLYDVLAGGDTNLLLVFYDPDCDHCREVMERMAADPRIAGGDVRVLAVYSGDDSELWERTAPGLPEAWVVGYDDGAIEDSSAYYIPAPPTLYLIAPDGTVLQKEMKTAP